MTRILFRYVTQQHLPSWLLISGGLSILFSVGLIFEIGKYLLVNKSSPFLVAQLLFYRFPELFISVVPLATMGAVMMTLGRLSKDNEILIMRMAGLRNCMLVTPSLMIAVVSSLLVFAVSELVVTSFNHEAETVLRRIIFQSPVPQLTERVFFRDKERFFYVGKVDPAHRTLQHVLIGEIRNNYMYRMHTAPTGVYEQKNWVLHNGRTYEFDKNGSIVREVAFQKFNISMDDISEGILQVAQTSKDMNIIALTDFVEKLSSQGVDITSYKVDLHMKAATALTPLVFGFVSGALFLFPYRRERWHIGFFCVLLAFSYYVSSSLFAGAGRAHILPPAISVWIPPTLFMGIGAILLVKGER